MRAEQRYEVGVIDLYADANTGDLGGSYLPIAAFSDEVPAAAFYHDLQGQIHEQGLAPYQVPDFAEARAFEMNAEPENWRGAQPVEYAAYESARPGNLRSRRWPMIRQRKPSTRSSRRRLNWVV